MYLLRDSFCLSALSLPRQRHDILDFAHCLGVRVCGIDQPAKFGFEFHLRSLPFGFSRRSVTQPVELLNFLLLLHRADENQQVETALHSCNSWLSVWTLSCRCPLSVLRSMSIEYVCMGPGEARCHANIQTSISVWTFFRLIPVLSSFLSNLPISNLLPSFLSIPLQKWEGLGTIINLILVATSFPYVLIDWIVSNNRRKVYPVKHKQCKWIP